MHFRLSRTVAYGLVDRFRMCDEFTSMENLVGRLKVTAEKHILCFLWFVGHESASYRDVADRFGITISTLYHVISRVTQFFMSLAPNYIKYPSAHEKLETATFYEERKGFPGIISNKLTLIYLTFIYFIFSLLHSNASLIYDISSPGAIYGSYVRIDKLIEDPDSYINRKQYFSLHMQGIVNHKMKFIDIFVGYPGSVHDARVSKLTNI
ncbi:PREDICTED: uncharacterized protein LOC106745700 isoform X1 [Dinoponera quadriceps]|uniref:Uncharacterized protein LOC106745700 isoform X1 n=1 Tax=Dinoponera quadriceps TaxID=609295 RepID=A0A6P3XEX7_DINQU|nr:PREDICTED: uncharacterized protein LOC106745700 isoform X1 [Dinoponera quadriceps]XP_014477037.1 PREDICTED: uncharacterized protein LOC106745700 isoform X1 [Dinoponera quadriceps]